ncbi:N-terminal acetyltransferase B complex auxiliary subunit NAA25-like protein [Drosera capensis]
MLSGKLGSLLTIEVDRLRLEGRLLAQSGDHTAAISTFQKILHSRPDDWECFLQYLSCVLDDDKSWCFEPAGKQIVFPALTDNLLPIPDDVFDSRITYALAFVKKLQVAGRGETVRGPFLADIEIERRKRLHQKGDSEKFLNVIVQYFCRYGHLSCFCSDVEAYLELLNHEEKNNLVEKLKQNSKSQPLESVKSLGRLMNLQKMLDMIGKNYGLTMTGVHLFFVLNWLCRIIYYGIPIFSFFVFGCIHHMQLVVVGVTDDIFSPELEGVAMELVDMYCKSLPLSRDLDVQESMHGEELLTMASNILVQLFWRSQKHGYILEAVMVLELGLTVRRYVSQYKLSLLHLYTYLGALPVAYDWYKTLDIKNILFETVLHQILPQMLLSPLWVDLSDILNDYLKFMDDHLRESADLTFLAYRHRNYSKGIEFVQFKELLQHSNQYLIAQLESSILQLKDKADRLQEEVSVLEDMNGGAQFLELASETVCKALTFNEDMRTRPWWTPTPKKNYLLGPFEDLACSSRFTLQECKRDWDLSAQNAIRKRSLLPRLIYLSVRCASAALKVNAGANGSVSESIFLELQSLLERFVHILGFSLNDALHVMVEVSQGRKSVEDFGSDMMDWANFAVFYNAWSLNGIDRGLQGLDGSRPAWNMAAAVLEKCILQKLRTTRPLVCCSGGDFPVLVNLITESLAWHGLVLQSCAPSSVLGGKKKKKSGTADQPSPSSSQAIRESVHSMCETLEVVTKWLREQISQVNVESVELSLSGQDNGPGQALHALRNYISSADEVELGDRIFHALKAWSPAEVTRKMSDGQCKILSELLHICTSKLKVFMALKQQL